MPLRSKFFTEPKRNDRLEECLVEDSRHVAPKEPPERGPHVALIQSALFAILPKVDFGDEIEHNVYGPLTADAVFEFKNTRTPKILNPALHQTVPDNIVGRRTIAALDEEMERRDGGRGTSVTVTAPPLSGLTKFRLTRNAGEFVRDREKPVCQMVPAGGIRNVTVSTGRAGDKIGLDLPSPPHATASFSPGAVTLHGLGKGDDDARFTINGSAADGLRVIVRESAKLTVHLRALADPKSNKGALGFEAKHQPLVDGLNRIYQRQANITFTKGEFATLASINGRAIDFALPIKVNPRVRDPNKTEPGAQFFTIGAFLPHSTRPIKEINVFVTPGLTDTRPNDAGTSSIFAELLCWARAESMTDPGVSARLVGHEIGHLLRMIHLDRFPGTLMFPALNKSGEDIPGETLELITLP
jgi:hypothetical protein